MCKTCGKGGKISDTKTIKKNLVKDTPTGEENSRRCRFCGKQHPADVQPYSEPFPHVPQFPEEGIYGMYPIPTTCKRDIMDHMLRFQRELVRQAEKTRMRVKMMQCKSAMEKKLNSEDPNSRVICQLDQLEADIQQLKHELAVEALRKKYGDPNLT